MALCLAILFFHIITVNCLLHISYKNHIHINRSVFLYSHVLAKIGLYIKRGKTFKLTFICLTRGSFPRKRVFLWGFHCWENGAWKSLGASNLKHLCIIDNRSSICNVRKFSPRGLNFLVFSFHLTQVRKNQWVIMKIVWWVHWMKRERTWLMTIC